MVLSGLLSKCKPRNGLVRPTRWTRRVAAGAWSSSLAGSHLPPITKVEQIIMDTIKSTGPITFAAYMQMCLAHPTAGYYTNPSNPVFGAKGDFITSPEISQVFGELVGVWLTHQYINDQSNKPIRIVELGPGRGTLMKDILRVMGTFQQTRAALRDIHLVETSDSMKSLQEQTLASVVQERGWQLHTNMSLKELPRDVSTFTMVIAHEFFDALPFHLLQKTHHGWQEVLISLSPDPATPVVLRPSDTLPAPTSASQLSQPPRPRFHHVLSPSPTASATLLGLSSTRFQKLPVGSRIEVSPVSFKIAHQIGELIKTENGNNAGCSLVVDYGGENTHGNSFRAFRNHKIVDVFHRPGESDLTTNVDFGYLKEAVSPNAFALGPIEQHTFLLRMGLSQRVDKLRQAASDPERSKAIGSAAERLIDPIGMGSQYKVLGITGHRDATLTADEKAKADYPFVEFSTDVDQVDRNV